MACRTSLFALALSTLPLASAAGFADSASTVSSLAVDLASKVNAWSSPDGLVAALGIQNAFGPLSDAVIALSSAAGSATDADIDATGTTALGSAIAELLGALVQKAGDFNGVGALSIVQNDISSLQGPSVTIVQDIVNAVAGDCDKIGSLTEALNSMGDGFSSADSAYSIAVATFPAAPTTCGASSTGASSAPVTTGPTTPTSTTPAQCTSTLYNQGVACKADDDALNLWKSANQFIHSLLQDVVQAADAIGFGFIADLATLFTSFVDSVSTARTHLKQLECLAPSDAADFFTTITNTVTSLTSLVTGLNKGSGLLKWIPGSKAIVQTVLQAVVTAFNPYVTQIASFLQGYPGNYPCYLVTALNDDLQLLNNALTVLGSVLGVQVPSVTKLQVTNCRNPTTVVTTACKATSAA